LKWDEDGGFAVARGPWSHIQSAKFAVASGPWIDIVGVKFTVASGPWSDIWSVGVLILELCLGEDNNKKLSCDVSVIHRLVEEGETVTCLVGGTIKLVNTKSTILQHFRESILVKEISI